MSKPASRWWTSPDGLRLHARDYGGAEGPAKLPVIAIHGLTRNSRDFETVAPYIAASGRRVVVVSSGDGTIDGIVSDFKRAQEANARS